MKKLFEIDFMHCSRRSLLLFVTAASIIGWVAIFAALYVACLVIEWVGARSLSS